MSHEFAFEVKLVAVVRVKAAALEPARRSVEKILTSCEPTQDFLDGYNSASEVAQVLEATLSPEGRPELVEVDGEAQ